MALDPTKLINPKYASQIGARVSAADPNVAEYYNKQSNAVFENPQILANFVQSSFQNKDVNPNNVFEMLQAPVQVMPVEAKPTRVDELQKNLFTAPISSQNIYDEEFNKAGLNGLKTQLSDFDKKINDIKQKYAEKLGTIGENPWLSESSRVGRGRILHDQMQAEIGNYLEQKNQLSDLYNMGLNEVKLRVGLRTDDFNNQRSVQEQELEFLLNQNKDAQGRQQDAMKFAYDNGIQSPFFEIGGTRYRTSDLKPYSTYEDYLADGGTEQNFQKVTNEPEDKLLSPTEAARLGVPYGTTQQEAATLAITPGFGRTSSGGGSTRKSTSSGSSGSKPLTSSDSAIRNWILSNKRENPDVAYFDLWGQLVDEMTRQGLNPANYDKLFWELLHPEGEAGYQKEQDKKKQQSKREV